MINFLKNLLCKGEYYVEWYKENDPSFFQPELGKYVKLSEVRKLGLRPNDMNCWTKEESRQYSREIIEADIKYRALVEAQKKAKFKSKAAWKPYGWNKSPRNIHWQLVRAKLKHRRKFRFI